MVAVGISSESRIGFGGCEFPQGFLVERQLENGLHNKSPFTPARIIGLFASTTTKRSWVLKTNGVIFRFVSEPRALPELL